MKPLLIDPNTFQFNFTKSIGPDPDGKLDRQSIYLSLPLIENWSAFFDFTYKFFWIPINDRLEVRLENVVAIMELEVTASTYGHLVPKLKRVRLDMGTSDVYSTNLFHQWFIR
jgi:hypothetical protein